MNRSARLSSAKHWLQTQQGRPASRIAKSYRNRYGVDWECAILELAQLGIRLEQEWIEQLRRSLEGNRRRNAQKKAERHEEEFPDSDDRFAFIAGYTGGGAPFGVTWEEWEEEPW